MNQQAASEPPSDFLTAAYALDGPEANRELYAQWAETYESGFVSQRRYEYPEHVAEIFANSVPFADAPVLDVGCGTGMVGQALQRRGLRTIDGIDISPEMLEQARAKVVDGVAVYRTLTEADLTRTLSIESDTYAGVVSVGTFTHGHVGPAALSELVRITRPGGRATIGINAAHFAACEFASTLEALHAASCITTTTSIVVPFYGEADMSDPDQFAYVISFEVLAR